MAKNRVFASGRKLEVAVAAGVVSGDPVFVGGMTGVALTDRDADGNATVDFGGVYDLSVKGINDAGNVAVAAGDAIYFVNADTPKLSKKSSGLFFGYALEAVNSGATTTIQVVNTHGGAVGSLDLPAGTIQTTDIADDAITAAKIAANAVTGSELATGVVKASVANGVNETTPTNIPVTGMAVGDEVIAVLVFTTAASIATLAAHAGTFTAAAGGCTPGTAVDNTGNQYVVFWIDKTP